jgi:hypothetical protein
MKKPMKLSQRAAERDVLASACYIVERFNQLWGYALSSSIRHYGERKPLPMPEQPIVALDRHGDPIRDGEAYWLHLDADEHCQHWFVSDWLAKRLAENGDDVVLLCDSRYVWCRPGAGYAIEDDLTFLDEEDEDVDPTEDDHATVRDMTHEDADAISDGRGDFERSTTSEENLDKSGDDLAVNPEDC